MEIDLIRVQGVAIDISSEKGLELLGNGFARRLAQGYAEVLFDAPILASVITVF